MIREPSYEYAATLIRVVDGDTLYLRVDLGFNVSASIEVRLARIDAPEAAATGGAEATAYLTTLVSDRSMILRSKRRDKYGRWLGELLVERGWVSDLMMQAGHAKPWSAT